MTPSEFWYEEPSLLNSYIKKRELHLDETNYQAWLFGFYFCNAMSVVLSNAFGKKGSKKSTYFEKPLEEFNSNYVNKKPKITNANKDNEYRKSVNYWAKLGKKGV